MHIRRFSSEMKTLMPSPHVGMSAAPILFGREQVAGMSDEQMATRFNGLPILIDNSDAAVVALYFEPHARMVEHSNPRNTLFVVLRGQGFVRIGGPQGRDARFASRRRRAVAAQHRPHGLDRSRRAGRACD